MTDRELLELAAKAAEIEHKGQLNWGLVLLHGVVWNPLTDDGDALRLAVKLNIIVGTYETYANAGTIGCDVDVTVWAHEVSDPYAATRRAIVRAAAELGKEMK